jgi:hypothetical protein
MLAFFSDPAADSGGVSEPAMTTQEPVSNGKGQGWIFPVVLGAGFVAGLVSFFAGELIVQFYQSALLPRLSAALKLEDVRKFNSARVNSAALSFAMMGGVLGLAMGVAGGMVRRSIASCVRAGLCGLPVGAIATGAVAWIAARVFYDMRDSQSTDLLGPLACHGSIWLTAALSAGLALGIGMGGRLVSKIVGGAMAGAVVATILYEVIGALLFATGKTEMPLSTSVVTRAMAQMLVAVLSAGGAVLAVRDGVRDVSASQS